MFLPSREELMNAENSIELESIPQPAPWPVLGNLNALTAAHRFRA